MNRKKLVAQIRAKHSCLCVGLDSDIEKLPKHLPQTADGILFFNKQIIDATRDLCVAYKINTAFYESLGAEGWKVMEETVKYISGDHLVIADAKRGDIGNTSTQYAKAFFEKIPFDAITVAPYMGKDSISPFLQFKDKWVIILGLTSNAGSSDFQKLNCGNELLWQQVIRVSKEFGTEENTMYVIGATRADDLEKVRAIIPDHFLLIPGVGAQGGSISEVLKKGKNADVGLLINVSRSIIFAGGNEDFAAKAREAALSFKNEMKEYL